MKKIELESSGLVGARLEAQRQLKSIYDVSIPGKELHLLMSGTNVGKSHVFRVIPNFPENSKPIGKCPKCGLDLYREMYYVCYKEPCAAGLGSKSKL